LASAGLISGPAIRGSDPQNLSYPLRMVEGSVTPPNLLFVRDHFREPEVSLDSWKLRIEGRVERPYELGFADLVELPSRRLEAVLECAGNAAHGSAVSSGLWEGVRISSLLESARPAADAACVLLEGADSGSLVSDGPPLPYSQVVPIEKCREDSSLLAFKYNDLTLPKHNGFPARALFPGWYGMDSVKWLRRMVVLHADEQDSALQRSGMDRLYNRVTAEKTIRLSTVQVKSAIAWPTEALKLPAGHYVVWGFAWSGTDVVRNLSVSVNNGKDWDAARLEPQTDRHSWVRWSYGWQAKPGEYSLMSRASDAGGNEQPVRRDPARRDGYELNWCMPIRCSVR
jgi:DMSO/TMAO reductase YedYZ molybdopterin-dependent catalytic subunit